MVGGAISRLGVGPTLVVAFLLPAGIGVTRAGASFDLGVAAGEVTSTSARLWAHSSASGPVMVDVSTNPNFLGTLVSVAGMADSANDNTVQVDVTGLTPDRVHYYRFTMGAEQSRVGSFRAAPDPEHRRTIQFGLTGDADAQPDPMTMMPAFNIPPGSGRCPHLGSPREAENRCADVRVDGRSPWSPSHSVRPFPPDEVSVQEQEDQHVAMPAPSRSS